MITSKPNKGEPVIERQLDPILGEQYVCSETFWNFLDEISVEVSKNTDGFEFNEGKLISSIRAQIAKIEEQISDEPLTSDCDTFTVDSDFFTADMDQA